MNKLWVSIPLVLSLMACKQNVVEIASKDTSNFEISVEKWPKKVNVNAKVGIILKDWTEYQEMDASFDRLYTVANTEDLKLVVEELIENQKLLEASTYPEIFDKPQIRSRQKVFKTYFLKIKGDLEYRQDTEVSVLETINAYNALRNQFNIAANNTLDAKMILLDE